MRFIPKTIVSSIMDNAILKGMLPLAVSFAIVVVKTLVKPNIFPPIIWATPSSAKARLKLATVANRIPFRASLKTAKNA